MKQIPLANWLSAIVDDDDYDWLSKTRWTVNAYGYAVHGYAKTITTGVYEKGTLFMHREIIGARKGYDTDHINGNKLDNRKCNLRECTRSQNNANRSVFRANKTGFKGVNVDAGKYRATIRINKVKIHLGLFNDPKDAALAYNSAAVRYFGEFARINQVYVT